MSSAGMGFSRMDFVGLLRGKVRVAGLLCGSMFYAFAKEKSVAWLDVLCYSFVVFLSVCFFPWLSR
jgi:hypothetical protein